MSETKKRSRDNTPNESDVRQRSKKTRRKKAHATRDLALATDNKIDVLLACVRPIRETLSAMSTRTAEMEKKVANLHRLVEEMNTLIQYLYEVQVQTNPKPPPRLFVPKKMPLL